MADEAQEVAEFDPASLIEDGPAPAADTDAKEAEQPEATEAEAKEAKAGDAERSAQEVEKPAEPEKPREGTPDKALQKMQQDFAALQRELQSLKAGKATPEKIEKAERKADAIKKRLAEEFDVFEAGKDLGEALVETADDVESLKQTVRKLESRLEERESAKSADENWSKAYSAYPEVDRGKLKDLWKSTVEKHAKRMGANADPQLVVDYATEEFNNHAKALNNQAAAKKKTNKPVKPAGVVEQASEQSASGIDTSLENFKRLAMEAVPDDD